MLPTKEGNVELGVPLVLSEILLLYPAELNKGLGLVKGVKESWLSTMFSLFPDSLHSVGFAFVVAGVFALWSRTEISASLVPSSSDSYPFKLKLKSIALRGGPRFTWVLRRLAPELLLNIVVHENSRIRNSKFVQINCACANTLFCPASLHMKCL